MKKRPLNNPTWQSQLEMEKMLAMIISASHSTTANMVLAEPLLDSNPIFAMRTACAVHVR